MPKIYIAGPMSGYPEFNFPAFFEAEAMLKEQGYIVANPANKDAEVGLDAEACKTGDDKKLMATGWDFKDAFLWDVTKVIEGDAIFMLRGWEQSMGAVAEHAVAVSIQRRYPEYRIMYQ